MAGLRNSDGHIVIDKQQAESDIRNIEQTRQKLAEVRKMIDPSKLDDSHMLGETRTALADSLTKMNKELREWESKCEAVANEIKRVVSRYERIDREYAQRQREGS